MGIAVIFFIIIAIALLILGIKNAFGPVKFKVKTFFLSGEKNHNSISIIERGNCELEFKDGKFYIKQGENQIEDNCADIDEIRTWLYKGGLYMAISMTTHSEYKFSLAEPKENNELSVEVMNKLFKTLAQRLKVQFNESGASDQEED